MRRSTAILSVIALVALGAGCGMESPTSLPTNGPVSEKAGLVLDATITPTAAATAQGLTATAKYVETATRTRLTVTVTGFNPANFTAAPGAEAGVLVAPLSPAMSIRAGGARVMVDQVPFVVDPILNPAGIGT